MSKDQQDEPVCRKPAQQDHRKVDRGPVTPEAQKRASASELGNAIIEVLKGDGKLLADTVKSGCLFHGDDRDTAVFEQIRSNCVPKLDWSPTVVTPTKKKQKHKKQNNQHNKHFYVSQCKKTKKTKHKRTQTNDTFFVLGDTRKQKRKTQNDIFYF